MLRTSASAGALCLGLFGVVFVAGQATHARADGSAIVVVIESEGPRIDAASLRRALSEQLDAPVVSLRDARASSARGVLSIVVDESGRQATVEFRPRVGVDYGMQVSVEAADARSTGWVVTAAASVIRASESWGASRSPATEILDPWGDTRVPYLASSDPMQLPPEVIDPFVGSAPGPLRITAAEFHIPDEVLDPWADVPADSRADDRERGPGDRLSRPAPGRAPQPAR